MYDSKKILVKIESHRNKMAEVALEKGLTSKESISLSQELDRLLNSYEMVQRREQNGI